MAVDLSDLVENLKREVNAPGLNQFPDATDAQYVGNLQDGFWESVLDGAIIGYTESDAIVTPKTGTTDLPRELQQLVIFYAGARILRNQLRDIKSSFKAKAGPVEFEQQQSASLLVAILKDLMARRLALIDSLVNANDRSVYYFDGLAARESALSYQDSYWVNF